MIRSIPPKTSTGSSRAIRGGKRKSVELGRVIKTGIGERKEAVSNWFFWILRCPRWMG